ncbi:FtsW/RodA/SpoVE family cell cycle protein [Robertmurraya korlensis]|uniref:FtsW/RodA/SpoVE family cell cycle protein n=1 Tax=Robertmurraya korlensis TaxID=519977 RepID=UPI00203E7401|nr:FtsW/RodA/SpoVE family cell cycle protein [Robertmurraya korlensis]MCM3600404.1 FtsW/RodA/SpoVE family cell cycle protein [Robertmurraya korlensis]
MTNLKEHFLTEVMQYIKSREAKEVVYKELNYHLKMSKSELVSNGANENEAEEKAINQMGSPEDLGIHFNKLYRPIFDWKLFGLFIIIISMGILPIINVQEYYSENLMIKQTIYIVLGILVSITVMVIDYRKIKKLGYLFLIVALSLLLTLNFFPNMMLNGVSYLRIMGFTISGNSLLPFFLMFWAFYLSKEKPRLSVVFSVYLITVILIMRLPSLTDVFIYSILVLTLFISSSISKKAIYTTIGVSFGLLLIYVVLLLLTTKEYQWVRLLAFLNPEDYAQDAGYMYLRLKDFINSGGWFGKQEVANPIPELTTDMVFANITYFYGWLVAVFLLVLLSLLLFRMIVLSIQIKDRFGKQLILGVCSLLSVQFVYNVGMVLGLLPLISMSLPFISYGLTPTVLNSFLIGIVLSVYHRKNITLSI